MVKLAFCLFPCFTGVPVQGQLLPKFTELLLQGPSSAAAAVDDTAADLSASRQQRLSEWRMHRQSRLLFIHEQLAELPHALETLRQVWLLCMCLEKYQVRSTCGAVSSSWIS